MGIVYLLSPCITIARIVFCGARYAKFLNAVPANGNEDRLEGHVCACCLHQVLDRQALELPVPCPLAKLQIKLLHNGISGPRPCSHACTRYWLPGVGEGMHGINPNLIWLTNP